MKIAIVAPSSIPYTVGGAEKFWWGLLQAFNLGTRHEVELIKIPGLEKDFWSIIDSYRKFSELDLDHFDLVISTKYPAWMVCHRNHVVYMQHKLRGLYDTYPAALAEEFEQELPALLQPLVERLETLSPVRENLPAMFEALDALRDEWKSTAEHEREAMASFFALPGVLIRKLVHWFDDLALSPAEIRRYYAISDNVRGRRDYFPAAASVKVVHHPSDMEEDRCESFTHIFTASRLDRAKRIGALIEAFARVKTDREFRIAGTGPDEQRLRELAAGDHRVKFLGRLTDAEIAEQYSHALFVPFVPYDEDYGLITLEAMRCGKAVLGCEDSGGVNELLRHWQTGLSVPFDIDAIAAAMQSLVDDAETTQVMGARGRAAVAGISWPAVVEALLPAPVLAINSNDAQRPRIVVAVPFPVQPAIGGGQQRVFHLYRGLSGKADLTIVSLTNEGSPSGRFDINPHCRELRVAKSTDHQAVELQLSRELKASVGDIALLDHVGKSPDYLRALQNACADADLCIASHHYLYPALREVFRGPVVYESHNVEADMKAAILGDSPGADYWLQRNSEVEAACVADAEALIACSMDDAERFAELYGEDVLDKLHLVQNGTDTEAVRFQDAQARSRLRRRLNLEGQSIALFMGSWHGPNIDAVKHLFRIAAACPQWQFWVMGTVCDYFHRKYAGAWPVNVQMLGVTDADQKAVVLGAVDLALNPVDTGSGTNLKLVEYLVAGIPVLSTEFGCRGLSPALERHIVKASVDDFAQAIREYQEPPAGLLKSLSDGARREYSWAAQCENYTNFLFGA